jgi:hypothetical protein
MEESRKKLFRKKGYKPFWESDEEEEKTPEPIVPPENDEDTEKYKLIRGLMKKGLGSVIKRK